MSTIKVDRKTPRGRHAARSAVLCGPSVDGEPQIAVTLETLKDGVCRVDLRMTPTEAMSLSKLLAKASEMISPLAERENLHARIKAFKTSLKIEEIRLRDGRSKGVSKGGPRASDEGHDGYTG